MDNLRTEPSTRKVVRCPHGTTERLYCDNCDVCLTLPVTFRDVLNLQRNEESVVNFREKYGKDNNRQLCLVQYENGETILHWLVMYTDLYSLSRNPLLQSWNSYSNMVSCLLLVAPQLCSITNNEGETPLCAATKHCTQTPELVKLLLSIYEPSELHIPDNNGNTPLFNLLQIGGLAREPEHVDILAMQSLRNPRPPLLQSENIPKLHFMNIMENVQRIIEHANFCTENKDGLNILQFTLKQMSKLNCIINKSEHCKLLLNLYEHLVMQFIIQKDIPVCSTTGNHALSFVPNIFLVGCIIDKDISEINKRDPNGCTPLTNLINRDQFEDKQRIIELMESNGAEEENRFEIVNNIINQTPGYDVNMRDPNGATMLINYAANTDIVNKLLQLGSDVNIASIKKIDVITSACQSKNLEVVRTLVESNTALTPSRRALIAMARNYLLSSEDTAEWLEVFRIIISLRNCIGKKLIKSLPEIVQYGKHQSDRLQDLLYDIVRIRNNVSAEVFSFHRVDIYNLDVGVPLNPFSSILIDMSRCSWYFDFIQRVLDANLPVINTPDNCINPLTALLLGNLANKNNTETNKIANILIERGVNINSSVLNLLDANFYDARIINYRYMARIIEFNTINLDILIENVKFVKNTLRVPDALFIAVGSDLFELTEKLLPLWFGPPSALFMLRSWDLRSESFYKLTEILVGPSMKSKMSALPLERFANNVVMYIDIKFETIQDMLTASKCIQVALSSGQDGNCADNTPQICSLRDLSLYTVRKLVSERAARTGERLPDLLEQLSVPPLISKILALK